MEIRYATLTDLAEIMPLEEVNFTPEERVSQEVLVFQLASCSKTCFIAKDDDQLLGYLLAIPVASPALTDVIFTIHELPQAATYLAITALSIAPAAQGQGLGTLLLAALKGEAVKQGYQGIALTCHEELIGYYEWNGFADRGLSASQLGGQTWYDMVWDCPQG